ERGFTAVKHQREVGAGYFDAIATTVDPNSSTTALKGSTKEGQFYFRNCPPSAPATTHHNNGRELAPPSREGTHNTVASHPALVFRYPPPLRSQKPNQHREGKPMSSAEHQFIDKTHHDLIPSLPDST